MVNKYVKLQVPYKSYIAEEIVKIEKFKDSEHLREHKVIELLDSDKLLVEYEFSQSLKDTNQGIEIGDEITFYSKKHKKNLTFKARIYPPWDKVN